MSLTQDRPRSQAAIIRLPVAGHPITQGAVSRSRSTPAIQFLTLFNPPKVVIVAVVKIKMRAKMMTSLASYGFNPRNR